MSEWDEQFETPDFYRRYTFAVVHTVLGIALTALMMAADLVWVKASFHGLIGVLMVVLPMVSFLGLGVAAVYTPEDRPRFAWSGIWLSAFVGYNCILVPILTAYVVASTPYQGGGANIGAGLLILAPPLLMPLLMAAGFWVGLQLFPSRQAE